MSFVRSIYVICQSSDIVSIAGSMALEEEFDELSEEDAADRLLMLATKIDRNGDGKVDKDELEHWIIQSLK